MNHKCHGDYVRSLRLYRCLLDSTIIQEIDWLEICPNCKRPAAPDAIEDVLLSKIEQTVVLIGGNEFVVSEKRSVIEK